MSNCAGSDAFALQVLGDSMAPEFPDGCVVVSEPTGAVHDGCYVIADYKAAASHSWRMVPQTPEF